MRLVKIVPSLAAALLICRFLNRAFLSGAARPRPIGSGRHAQPVPEQILRWRKHPTLSQWAVGPFTAAERDAWHGMTGTLRDGTQVTLDMQTGTQELTALSLAWQDAPENDETRD